ncbi:aldehyde dehydrogenase family protein [Brochothrix thermosphacta]|uniref:aldehyde dehydrogenase family protein n=1 Tax=Brochothrix thermosphacta TaxID=2756 RepID=UPI00083FB592|nr:aldehyde dehydrogenase family protein [Brochothrix thermosphacta]ODJ62822.1 aldehyde dehydrogenase [Brochothrix thermosphacta]ODJ63067.1 aldehyde dehydrogenase [Brochothrix thermosphacta]SPN72660.1 putative aldehyde dehydrogenase AldA [Brochothrix thermosphacta]
MTKITDDHYGLYIGGKWITPAGASLITAENPSNGDALATFVDATHADVDAAVLAARNAFPTWKKVDVVSRSKMLLEIADLIDANKERLAMIETLDNGKPIRETSSVDVPFSADHFRYFAGVIRAEEGSVKDFDEDTLSIILKEPIGVVGQIVPWNFPILMAAWKIAPAIAAGNTLVIHPSSSTSLSLLELFKLLDQVLPPGVVNLITGRGSDSGDYMLKHDGFDKLAFTGSTEIGYEVAEQAAKKLIPATLELGGKSANIFFDDMPFDRAIEGAQLGILFNQGQVCCAGSRIFVQEGIYDKFIAALKTAFENVKVGLPWEMDTQMGAQVNQRQLEKIKEYIKIGTEEGAEVITGGMTLEVDGNNKGAFLAPTLLGNVDNNMRVAKEEIFGPVASVIKFKTIEEVIKLANDSEYGLGGGVWSTNINTALKVARGIETGRIWVNTYNQIPAGAPFGGVKKSGYGRETHKMMLDAYSQTKNIYISTKEATDGLY